MKTRFSIFLGVICAVALSQAGTLYWQIGSSVAYTDSSGRTESGTKSLGSEDENYAYARVVGGDSDNIWAEPTVVNYSVSALGASGGSGTVINLRNTGSAILTANLGDSAAKYIWVELFNADGDWIGRSEALAYSALSDYVYAAESLTPVSSNYLSITAINAVPEPTSGVLLLIGAGLLGLRRRKQQV